MENLVGVGVLAKQLLQPGRIPDVLAYKFERPLGPQPFHVSLNADAAKVIHYHYMMTPAQIAAGGVRADEAGASGDDGLRFILSFLQFKVRQ